MATLEQLSAALVKADAAGNADDARALAGEIRKMRTAAPEAAPVDAGKAFRDKMLARETNDLSANLRRGVRDVIDGGAELLARGYDKIAPPQLGLSDLVVGRSRAPGEAERVRALNKVGKDEADKANEGEILPKVQRVLGQVVATGPVGPVLGAGAKAVGLPALGSALSTGGMSAGGATGAAGLVARVAGGAATGGASAALINPDDAAAGAIIGGALPGVAMGAGKVARAVGGALRGDVSPEVAALAKRAQELGINIPADRLGNSRPMNALASALNYVPFSGRAATEDAMVSQLNRRLSNTFGQDSSNVTMALRKAQSDLGGQFDTVLKGNAVRIDPQFMTDLADAANKASRELGADGASIIGKQVEDIIAKAGTGQIDGQAAYNIKKTLDRIGQRNSPEAHYATDLKKALMGALDRSLGKEEAAAFAKTRQQYGAMLDLEKLAKNGAEGEISVARLANMKNIHNPEMQELADIAAQFVKPREGAHGAAQRAAAGAITFGLAGPAGLATGAGVGRGMNMLLNSQAAKNAALGTASPQLENKLADLLRQSGYRAAPVLSAQ